MLRGRGTDSKRRGRRREHWLLVAAALALAAIAAGAQASSAAQRGAQAADEPTYIVVGEQAPLAAYRGGVAGLAPTDPAATGARRLDADSAASRAYLSYLAAAQTSLIGRIESALGRQVKVRFRYRAALNGLALEATPAEAARIATLPGVERVVRDSRRRLLTDNGPQWIGAPAVWNDTAGGTKGEGVVVGVIDTGINADHPSFADIGGDGYNHSNPRGQFFGLCAGANALALCNDKLIGVYDFTPVGTGDDEVGHGSHTASTTAGNVLDASLVAPTYTLNRHISGVAPHANVIAYKACVGLTAPAGECLSSALVAAIDQATLDEVDVVNFSIGGGPGDPWVDENSLAFLNARRAGVFVSASAGNDGPGPGTVGAPGTSPWLMTVGAATHDRKLLNAVENMAGGASAPPADIEGKSLTSGYGPAAIVDAADLGFPLCGDGAVAADGASSEINPFPPGTFDGEIVVCDRGTYGRVAKGENVKEGGAGGMILLNDAANGDSLVGDAHALPAVHISFAKGQTLRAWLDSGSGHTGAIRGTVLDIRPENGDLTASFSSRGPNAVPGVIKPDVTAPGVDVLAAFHDAAGPAPQYGVISGTSMSSPHAAGAAALVRDLHPTWTPDEVRSALMTTAFTTMPGTGSEVHGVLKEDSATPADPFDMGAGRVDLRLAGKAGLVLDAAPNDYVSANPNTGGDPRVLNLPSMADDECDGTCFWTRQVKSTSLVPVTWTLSTSASPGVSLTAAPGTFTIQPGQTRTIVVTAGVDAAAPGRWHFGQVTLAPSVAGVPNAHLPVAMFVKGAVLEERETLHFHGNAAATGADHDSGQADEGFCSGDGKADLILCSGPYLLKSSTLSPSPPASWKGGPAEWGLGGANPNTIHDPNWRWCLRPDNPLTPTETQCPATETPAQGETTIEGPLTVEWWAHCLALCPLGPADWHLRLFADGTQVIDEQVTPSLTAPGVIQRLQATVAVPRVTADHNFTLQLEPVFLLDSAVQFAVYYDSTQPCPGADAGPCDSVVHMPVVGTGPTNQQPDAVDDSASIQQGGTATVGVLGNDGDPDGDSLEIVEVGSPSHGTATENADGTIAYQHNADGAVSDSFSYTVSDGKGGSDTATVAVAINQPPVAADDPVIVQQSSSVDVPVLGNDTDANGDTLSVASFTQGANGAVSQNADGSLKYAHGGSNTSDSFTYTVSDGAGGSDTATVTIAVNRPPTALDDAASVAQGGSVTVAVLGNDGDPDGDSVSVTSVGTPSNGTASENADGTLAYTHNGSNTVSDSFTYGVEDGRGGSDTATVRITIAKRPDLQVAELQAVNNRSDDDDDDFDDDGRRDSDDDDDDNDGREDDADDDDDNDNRRDGRARESDKVTITATIANTGAARAGSTKTEIRDGDQVLALLDTGSLNPGQQRKVSVVWNTRTEEQGEHTLTATADRTGRVDEASETNNSRSIAYTVQANQVQNGSFEQDEDGDDEPDGWSGESTGAGTASYSDGGSDGARSASTTGTGGNAALAGSPTWTSAPIAVTPGTLMDLQLSVLASGASSPASAGLLYLGALGNVLDKVTLVTTPFSTLAFTQFEQAVTIPAGVAQVRIVLAGFAPTDLATAGSVTFDDVGLFAR